MFVDICDSTQLFMHHDDEDVGEIFETFARRAEAIIKECGGAVNQFLGDGLYAIFGLNVDAHENQGVAACVAAQRIHEILKEFRLKIGIHCGYVSTLGNEAHPINYQDQHLVGKVVNIAAHICANGRPGETILSGQVHEIVRAHTICDARDVLMRKDTYSIDTLKLRHILKDENSVDYLESWLEKQPPLIGRNDEILNIMQLANDSFYRSGNHVHIGGDAGSGKTYLSKFLVDKLRKTHSNLTVFFCAPSICCVGHQHPIASLLNIVGKFMGLENLDKESLDKKLSSYQITHDLFAYAYLDTCGLASATWKAVGTDRRYFLQAELVSKLLLKLSLSRPVMIVLDDIHKEWPECELLIRALTSVSASRLLVLSVSKRPNIFLASHSRHIINLHPLPQNKVREIIRSLLHTTQHEDDIVGRAHGNPYFAVQLVKHLQNNRSEKADVSVPDTLDSLFAFQVQKLGLSAKMVLFSCAVLGQKFQISHLRELVDIEHFNLAWGTVLETGIIRAESALGEVYEFTHDLAQESIYRGIAKSVKQPLHSEALLIFKRMKPSNIHNRPTLLAYHAYNAGQYHLAYAYGAGAGVISLRASQPSRAKDNLALAFRALKKIECRNKVSKTVRTMIVLAKAYSLAGKPTEALDIIERIPEISNSESANRLFLIQKRIEAETSIKWTFADYTFESLASLESTIDFNSRVGFGSALRCAGMLADIGHFKESNERLLGFIETARIDDKGDHFGLLFPASSYCLSLISRNYGELNKQYLAYEYAKQAIKEVEHLDHSPKKIFAYAFSAVHFLRQKKFVEAEHLLKEAYILTKQFNVGMIYPFVACNYGYALHFLNKDPQALLIFEAGLEYAESRKFNIRRSEYYLYYALMCCDLGDLKKAVKYGQASLQLAERYGEIHIKERALNFLVNLGHAGSNQRNGIATSQVRENSSEKETAELNTPEFNTAVTFH